MDQTASNAGAGIVYSLGFIGALVYYIQAAGSFWDGLLGVVQAFIWPAMLVYELLDLVAA
jgi:hypothetical protein